MTHHAVFQFVHKLNALNCDLVIVLWVVGEKLPFHETALREVRYGD